MIMRVTAFLAVILVSVLATAATAATVNLRAISCKEFLAQPKDDLAYILSFLDGYYRTEDDPLVIDQGAAGVKAKQLAEYCVGNPSEPLLAATEKVFKKE